MFELAPVPPRLLKKILELDGYKLVVEDPFNWVLLKCSDDVLPRILPVILPRLGRFVDVDVVMSVLHKTQINNGRYFVLREIAKASCRAAQLLCMGRDEFIRHASERGIPYLQLNGEQLEREIEDGRSGRKMVRSRSLRS